MLSKRDLVKLFLHLVTLDSESGHERIMADFVIDRLKAEGARVHEDEAARHFEGSTGNIIAYFEGVAPQNCDDPFFQTPFLLNAHVDTVSPGLGICPKISDGVVTSSGSTILGADDKAGVAIILHVLNHLRTHQLPHPPLEIVFTVCEERDLQGSKHLDYDQLTAPHGLCLDGGMLGSFVLSSPFKAHMDIDVHGIASHAARPQYGVNAIQVAAQAISKMHLGFIDEETTCNIGTFRATGPINVLRDRAHIEMELRSRNEDKLASHTDHINRCLREGSASFVTRSPEGEKRSSVTTRVRRVYDGYKISEDHPLVQRVVQSAHHLDIPPVLSHAMEGSDANNLMAHGITAIIMGVGIQEAHTTREWISTYDLYKASRLLLRIVSGF